ncbi:TIGR04076 family protein [uncultured Faecalicoccus sp.]|uniref:TIGR04076 family protein n=1 Tax=uncultured Faecalicoccus sp. TaxID=1971760 RepID=UPI0025E12976|nr:TIGR04076 family protein [uncultured Faecalicoccus sp.]
MKPIKITALRQTTYEDLMDQYEIPQTEACSLQIGQSWICHEAACPEGFCPSAWQSLYPYVFALANGAHHLHDSWMKDPQSALVSCNDGFRPMSFLLEVITS